MKICSFSDSRSIFNFRIKVRYRPNQEVDNTGEVNDISDEELKELIMTAMEMFQGIDLNEGVSKIMEEDYLKERVAKNEGYTVETF